MNETNNIIKTIEYNGWVMNIDVNNNLIITKEGETRQYTIPDKITNIEHNNNYVWLTTEHGDMFQFKFEINNYLVGDVFDNEGGHKGLVASHVFGQGDEF